MAKLLDVSNFDLKIVQQLGKIVIYRSYFSNSWQEFGGFMFALHYDGEINESCLWQNMFLRTVMHTTLKAQVFEARIKAFIWK